jgi:hypothetical protein
LIKARALFVSLSLSTFFCDLVPLKGSGRCTSILTQWAFSAIASRGAHYFDQKPLLLIKHKMHVLCAGVLLLSEPHRRQFSGSDHSRALLPVDGYFA